MQNLVIGSDHGGILLKKQIIDHIQQKHKTINVIDQGPLTAESCDYPDFAEKVG